MGGPLADVVLLDGVAVAGLAVLIRSAIQATGLLVMVGLIAWMMRPASAAVRHLLWLGTMIALAGFPLATVFLPGWQVLPHWEAAGSVQERAPSVATVESRATKLTSEVSLVSDSDDDQLASAHQDGGDIGPTVLEGAPTQSRLSWQSLILVVWAIGCLVAWLPTAGGTVSLAWLEWTSARVRGGPLDSALRRAARRLGLKRSVRLLVNDRRSMPMMWGVLWPRVLIPAVAETWPTCTGKRSVLFSRRYDVFNVHIRFRRMNLICLLLCREPQSANEEDRSRTPAPTRPDEIGSTPSRRPNRNRARAGRSIGPCLPVATAGPGYLRALLCTPRFRASLLGVGEPTTRSFLQQPVDEVRHVVGDLGIDLPDRPVPVVADSMKHAHCPIRFFAMRNSQWRNLPRSASGTQFSTARGNGHHHVLHQFLGVGVLEPLHPGQPVDERLVDCGKLLPRLGIAAIPQAKNQARSGFGRLRYHGLASSSLQESTHPRGRSFTGRRHFPRRWGKDPAFGGFDGLLEQPG